MPVEPDTWRALEPSFTLDFWTLQGRSLAGADTTIVPFVGYWHKAEVTRNVTPVRFRLISRPLLAPSKARNMGELSNVQRQQHIEGASA